VALVALRRLKPLVRRRFAGETLSLELGLVPGASIRTLLAELRRHNLRVEGFESHVLDDGSERLRLDIRGPASLEVDSILSGLSQLSEVERIDLAVLHSLDFDAEEGERPPSQGLLGHLTRPAHRRGRRPSSRSATPGKESVPPR
jgi:hypothetical protein